MRAGYQLARKGMSQFNCRSWTGPSACIHSSPARLLPNFLFLFLHKFYSSSIFPSLLPDFLIIASRYLALLIDVVVHRFDKLQSRTP